MNKICFLSGIILAGALLFPACATQKSDIWSERPISGKAPRETRKQKRDHLRYVLSKVVLIRMNAKGQICIGEDDSILLTPFEFSSKLAQIGKAEPGKPVLFFYDKEAVIARPDVRTFIIRECNRANLGKIYTEVPEKI